jgi:hypothetical protein
MAQTTKKTNENRAKTMKTISTTFPPLNRPSPPPFSWEGVRWKVYSGDVGWRSYEPAFVNAAIRAGRSVTARLCVLLLRLSLALMRTLGFLVVAVCAVADAIITRIVAVPTAVAMAHARAAWLHRWSRAARWVLGVRVGQRGVTPASGIITANYSCIFDAILLAAVRPCVFVAGAEVRRWPVIGLLARLGGTLFVDPRRRSDVARVNFLIERAVRRRLLVVIFPECGSPEGARLSPFASALLQPAVELGCSLTAAAFTFEALRDGEYSRIGITHEGGLLRQFAQLVSCWRPRAIGAFCGPAFHHGNRKQLADQLRIETLDLMLRIATPDGGLRKSAAEIGMSKKVQIPAITEGAYLKRLAEPQTETRTYQLCGALSTASPAT